MDQSGDIVAGALALPEAHYERVERKIGVHARRDLPAHDEPAEHTENERGIDPARVRADVGEIRDPESVRSRCDEPSFDEVFGPLRLRAVPERRPAGLVTPDALEPCDAHRPFDGAEGDLDVFTIQCGVDLPRPVDTETRCVHHLDVFGQLRIQDRACGRQVGLRGVVGVRGDLHARVVQDPAERLDPEPVAVPVDVLDEHPGRHPGYFSLRSSSAAARNADAVFKISFARRSSRSNSAIRCVSAVGRPGASPVSISVCRTHVRNASGWIPSWSATRFHRAHLRRRITTGLDRHPRPASLELFAVLSRCCHDSHPSQV